MTALKTIVGFMEYPIRQWRKRRVPKKRQEPESEKLHVIEQFRVGRTEHYAYRVRNRINGEVIHRGVDRAKARAIAEQADRDYYRALANAVSIAQFQEQQAA